MYVAFVLYYSTDSTAVLDVAIFKGLLLHAEYPISTTYHPLHLVVLVAVLVLGAADFCLAGRRLPLSHPKQPHASLLLAM
jgi:hypothetical protein